MVLQKSSLQIIFEILLKLKMRSSAIKRETLSFLMIKRSFAKRRPKKYHQTAEIKAKSNEYSDKLREWQSVC